MVGRTGLGGRCLDTDGNVLSLTELAAKEVASSIPFEAVERVYPPVPEPLQLRIAFYRYHTIFPVPVPELIFSVRT
jgi:hypothetical protein